MDKIVIRQAREHNLKNISLEIPRNTLTVITGLSGSGKSSLAFDTIYAEGQRRYVESLSAYARQFLELMDKPEVEAIDGLSPAIAIEQRTPTHNPRSTVGTMTEIYDYLRLLFARIGIPYCPKCNIPIRAQTISQIVEEILKKYSEQKIWIFARVVRGRIGTYQELLRKLLARGFSRVRIDGKIYQLEEKITLNRYQKHTIEVLIDRVVVSELTRSRVYESVELASKESDGNIIVLEEGRPPETIFNTRYGCRNCGFSLGEIEPRLFSFNSPYGACPTCDGLGTKLEIAEDLVVPDKNLSIRDGALKPYVDPITTRTHRWKGAWKNYYWDIITSVGRQYHIDLDKPFRNLAAEQKKIILYGDGNFEGVIGHLQRRYQETESEYVKEAIYNTYMRSLICPTCQGKRLKPEALSVKIKDRSISDICALSIAELKEFFNNLNLEEKEKIIARNILKEINQRLQFLINVGLDYLTLDRETATLAGGEAQRIHLATQIGANLTGVLYVLDEPSIGLHPRDNTRLLNTLKTLRDNGNTLIVVEHDEETIRNADFIVDLGPGAGIHGGKVVYSGELSGLLECEKSLTGQYLTKKKSIPVPKKRRPAGPKFLTVEKASQFNLKEITVKIPLGCFVAVTGVSGSGKSTLVYEVIYKALAKKLYQAKDTPGRHRAILGTENLDKVIIVDQSPIGRTPRSNPATYTGMFTPIRELFASVPLAMARGYKPGRFSFNVPGGRCETCQGDGTIKISMQFLPDVYVRCEACGGKRFNEETLLVKFKDKNISEVLEMSVEEALAFFANQPKIKRILEVLNDVGLGYIKLGQSATTLSGGEAQRVKLATELCRRDTGSTLYILDEPTTGLHFADVEKLLNVLHRLVNAGNTVLIIEHNLEVIKTADWIIDLGPEGGERGGEVVAAGLPEEIVKNEKSYTGKYLARIL